MKNLLNLFYFFFLINISTSLMALPSEKINRAISIAESRAHYYFTLLELLKNEDPVYQEFQKEMGELLGAFTVGQEWEKPGFTESHFQKLDLDPEQALLDAAITNVRYYYQLWETFILGRLKIIGEQKCHQCTSCRWTRRKFIREITEQNDYMRGITLSAASERWHIQLPSRLAYLESELEDYEQIIELLGDRPSGLSSSSSSTSQSSASAAAASSLSSELTKEDWEELGISPEDTAAPPKKKHKNKKKKNGSVTKKDAGQASRQKTEKQEVPIPELQDDRVEELAVSAEKATEEPEKREEQEVLMAEPEEDSAEQSPVPFVSQPTPGNPKWRREQARMEGISRKTSALLVTNYPVPILNKPLKAKHRTVLEQILRVGAAHPPSALNATRAIRAIIKRKGGSIHGALEGGGEVEIWIGGVRFLVHGSHKGSNGDLYPDQMAFMASGLKRCGITLESLALF